ncbi:MAG: hypothetical protein HYV33_05685 [Candidatus Kerfeldbacteria bacterium]|nr:hypothetical protein [Candidatus Kerfeldbacteria bacterium]
MLFMQTVFKRGTMIAVLLLASWGLTAVAADFDGDDFDENFEGDFEGDGDETPVADNTATAAIEPLGPFGGDLWDVAVDTNNGLVYTVAKDSPNGFYRSSDSGDNWTGLSGVDYGGGIAVEVNPDTGTVFAAFNNGVYASTDAGETFTQISSDVGSALLYAQGVLIASSNSSPDSVLVSNDDGASFSTIAFTTATDETVWDIDYSADDDSWYVLTTDTSDQPHLYHSTDGAASWTETTLPTFTAGVSDPRLAVNPLAGQNLIISAGFSSNAYYTVTGPSGWIDAGVQTSGVSFDHTGRVWSAEQFSDNGGVTWQSYDDDNTSTALGGHNVTVDPGDENIVYADGMPGLSRSADRGVTWTDINEGTAGVTITDISQADNKDVVWAAAYNGIAKTENFTSGTPTWQFPVLEEPGTGIWTNPTNPDVVVVGIIGAIKRSTDGGVTWSDNLAGDLVDLSSNVDEIIADVADPNTLYAAVSNGDPNAEKVGKVLQSNDQGLTWEDMNLLDDGSAQTITQASNGDIYVGIGAESDLTGISGIYKFSDGAWSKLDNAPTEDIVKLIVDPNDDNVIYAIASVLYNSGASDDFGFYLSSDAGDSWTKITEGLTELRGFNSLAVQSSTSPTTLYLGAENFFGQGTLLKSADAGTTWGVQYTGLQSETFYTLLFDGVTLGSSRGLYDVKSKATLTVKANQKKIAHNSKVTLTATLKDAVTDKKLKNSTIKLYEKNKSGLKLLNKIKTNSKGKATLKVRLRKVKQYKFQATWTPKGNQTEEYTNASSSILKVTAK